MGRNRDNYGGTPPLPLMLNEGIIQQQPDQVSLTERYVEQSVRFIRENQDRPFFLYMTHMYVHVPLYVPDRFMRGSRNGLYGGAVSCIDWATEVILYELKALGLDEQTLVIFTSDNGARWTAKGGNDPLRGWKSTTWEGGFRLPCIMRWPGHIPAGSVCRVMITAMDFYPTLATIGGAEIPGDRIIDGQDIRYLIFSGGQGESPHDAFFYYKHGRIEAVRSGKWKLHVGKSEVGAGYKPMQKLYDLEADPGESEDRYAAKPDVVAALMAKVEACRQDLGDETTGTIGKNVREPGRVENPQPMTAYDVNHPYIIEEYDLKDERV
jgi:arylsulfatase A-like enzyme